MVRHGETGTYLPTYLLIIRPIANVKFDFGGNFGLMRQNLNAIQMCTMFHLQTCATCMHIRSMYFHIGLSFYLGRCFSGDNEEKEGERRREPPSSLGGGKIHPCPYIHSLFPVICPQIHKCTVSSFSFMHIHICTPPHTYVHTYRFPGGSHKSVETAILSYED